MRKITLTESQFKTVVKEMMGENGYQRGGFVSPDGNSMTGGRWGHSSDPHTVTVSGDEFLDWLDQQGEEDSVIDIYWDELYNGLYGVALKYDASRETGFDDSVGTPHYDYVNLDNANYSQSDAIFDSLNVPDDVKQTLKQELRNYAEAHTGE